MSRNVRQTLLVAGLAKGLSVEEAAAEAGVSARTAFRWMAADPAIRTEVITLQREAMARALGVLSASSRAAATTLASLSEAAASESVRLAAARTILEVGPRLRESIDLEQRLAELESALADGPGRRE